MTQPTISCYLHGPYFGDDCQGCIATRYLMRLGKVDHPDATKRPVHALGQVAVDLQQALNLSTAAKCLGSCGSLEARRQAFASARYAAAEALRRGGAPALVPEVLDAIDAAGKLPPGPPDPPPPPPGRKVA